MLRRQMIIRSGASENDKGRTGGMLRRSGPWTVYLPGVGPEARPPTQKPTPPRDPSPLSHRVRLASPHRLLPPFLDNFTIKNICSCSIYSCSPH